MFRGTVWCPIIGNFPQQCVCCVHLSTTYTYPQARDSSTTWTHQQAQDSSTAYTYPQAQYSRFTYTCPRAQDSSNQSATSESPHSSQYPVGEWSVTNLRRSLRSKVNRPPFCTTSRQTAASPNLDTPNDRDHCRWNPNPSRHGRRVAVRFVTGDTKMKHTWRMR